MASLVALVMAIGFGSNTLSSFDDTCSLASGYHEKSSTTHTADQSFPFEQKEKEMEDRDKVNPGTVSEFFVCLSGSSFISHRQGSAHAYSAPRSCGDATNLPLFLAKRTILI